MLGGELADQRGHVRAVADRWTAGPAPRPLRGLRGGRGRRGRGRGLRLRRRGGRGGRRRGLLLRLGPRGGGRGAGADGAEQPRRRWYPRLRCAAALRSRGLLGWGLLGRSLLGRGLLGRSRSRVGRLRPPWPPSDDGASPPEPAPSPSSITASCAPTSTVSSSPTAISRSTPAAGEGISVSTLSVDTSRSGSSASTRSPSFFSQRVTVPSVTLSPSWGMDTETDIVPVTPS